MDMTTKFTHIAATQMATYHTVKYIQENANETEERLQTNFKRNQSFIQRTVLE